MARVRTRVVVHGRVQGVWFRDSTRRTATELDLTGWVRNTADGAVEAVFEGPADRVAQAVAWTRHGPEAAVVTKHEEFAEQPEGLLGFHITH